MQKFLSLTLLALCCGTVVAAPQGKAARDWREPVVAAEADAQNRCYRLIHHDTFAFESCLRALLATEKKATPRRLGVEYFGFVGALNSARMGMLGAEQTAWEFMTRFRATQHKLKIGDAELCATIAGDCEVRLARLKQMEAGPRPQPLGEAVRLEHDHAH